MLTHFDSKMIPVTFLLRVLDSFDCFTITFLVLQAKNDLLIIFFSRDWKEKQGMLQLDTIRLKIHIKKVFFGKRVVSKSF